MAFVFRNEQGQLCRVATETLSDIERNYHPCDCNCELCRAEEKEEQTMVLKHTDEIVDKRGGYIHRYTVGELVKKQAGDRLHRFALDHMQRHPGVSYVEALGVAKRLNPEWARMYAVAGWRREKR